MTATAGKRQRFQGRRPGSSVSREARPDSAEAAALAPPTSSGIVPAATLNWRPEGEKFRVLAGALLGLSAVYGVTYLVICAAKGWPHGFGDSFALWSWGHFLGDHPAAAIYDSSVLRSAQLALGLNPGASYPFAYPPSFLLALWPLGQLPGLLSFAVLTIVGLPLYLWATVGRSWRSSALFAALAAPTTAIAVGSGQSGFLAAALLAGGMRLAAGNPVAGGVLLGLLTYKPQLGLLVPIALIAARLWQTIAAAALTALFLVIVTTLLFGAAIWPSWIATLPAFSHQFSAENSAILHLMPTLFAALTQYGVASGTALLAQGGATVAGAVAVWVLFRSSQGALAGAGLLVATLLATPYAFVYDMPILATAVIWFVAERRQAGAAFSTGEVLLMMLAMIAPITLVAGGSRFPLTLLTLALLFGAIVRREHVRSRQQ